MSLFVGYHGVPASEHQARFDELSAEGYRITSLNVSGHPADARYAVVWIQREGPAWVAMHGISAAEYQTRFDTLVGEGYAPVLVSATGGDADAVYAAVFEASHTMPWFARHGVKWGDPGMEGTINFENQKAFDHGYVPICLAVYGTPGDERFAGIWVKNDKPVPWAWWWTDPTAYQNYFNADVEAGTRLAYVSVAPSQWILSVFRDEPIGEWYARHGLTADDYQAEFDARTADGLEPLVVQAGGSGADKRYACVFVRSDTPIDREWHMRGPLVYHGSILDGIAAHFMKSHAIRAMSIAIARAERLLAQRAYTWAEPGYPITQPDALFRVASVSKVFTCACIDQLVRDEALMQSTQAFPFLGITTKLMGSRTPIPTSTRSRYGILQSARADLATTTATTFEPFRACSDVTARRAGTTSFATSTASRWWPVPGLATTTRTAPSKC